MEAGPEQVHCTLDTPTSVLVRISRRVHAHLQRKWPGVQFLNYSDGFLPDQDITLTVRLPCACAAPCGADITASSGPSRHGESAADSLAVAADDRVAESLGTRTADGGAAVAWVVPQYIKGFHVLELDTIATPDGQA